MARYREEKLTGRKRKLTAHHQFYERLTMAKQRNVKGGKRKNRKEIRKSKGHVV